MLLPAGMVILMLIMRIANRLLLIALFIGICDLFSVECFAQNSHFSNLKSMYLSQNPEAAKRVQQANQDQLPPKSVSPSTPPNVMLPGMVPAPSEHKNPAFPTYSAQPASGQNGFGVIANPLGSPNSPVPTAQETALPAETGLLNATIPFATEAVRYRVGGDRRDPLRVHSVASIPTKERVPLTPYDEMLADARLNDICFPAGQSGWAVGDRGAIWHTKDGGKQWVLQETPISCPLYSVSFLNESIGFAVGGYHFPFSSQGCGVILSTHDGGINWKLEKSNLPVLRQIHVFDAVRILAVGETSEEAHDGRFLSSDAGQTWKPLNEGQTEGWKSVAFENEKSGFGIGLNGTPQIFRDRVYLSESPDLKSIQLTSVQAIPNAPAKAVNGWMVGEEGNVLYTLDQGLRWSVTKGKLTANTAGLVDLNTLAVHGKTLWVAGNPGTFIYRSDNNGATWTPIATGSSVPINKILIKDDKTGYAVGDLGTILQTEDGGKTWNKQRAGGARLAVLGLFAQPEDVPLEAFAQLCGDQGFLGGVLLLFRAENESQSDNATNFNASLTRLHEALLRTGANGAWNLGTCALPDAEFRTNYDQLLAYLQKKDDGQSLRMLRERLVAAIRQWKPEVILTSGIPAGSDPSREFVLREIMEAVKLASDPTAFPLQLTEQGLIPWNVKKIHYALEDGQPGDVNIRTEIPSARLGQTLDEIVFVARGLIDPHGKTAPPLLGFITHYDECVVADRRDLLAGIELPYGSDARRNLYGSFAEFWEEINARTESISSTRKMIRHLNHGMSPPHFAGITTRIASNVNELTRKIDPEASVMALLEMAKNRQAAGDWESAREAYEILARDYVTHPLARTAAGWLISYYAAEEMAWRFHQNHHRMDSVRTFSPDGKPVQLASASQQGTPNREAVDPRLEQALGLEKYMDATIPHTLDAPEVRFALASVQRKQGKGHEALKYFRTRGGLQYDDVWGMRARAEVWLATPDKTSLPETQRELPLPYIRCVYTAEKPRLDGLFGEEDKVWYNSHLYSFTPKKTRQRLSEILKPEVQGKRTSGLSRETELAAKSKNFGTQAMFLYDKEYLYVALRCKKVAEFSYPAIIEKARSRDADITNQDRVEIQLDLDRDYGTSYRFTFDSRCWVADSSCHDATWNPVFSVSRPLNEDSEYWYVEAAIPWNSLTDRLPMPGDVWAISLRRLIPGAGTECWNAENSFDLEDGFGFLVFE